MAWTPVRERTEVGGTVADRALVADRRRALQRALGLIWLLDGALQFQPFMFGRGFPQTGARAQAACKITMGITMGYLLVLML
jgi:hypothetical protein